MVGKNMVRLEIDKEYPKLHPLYNISLVVKYIGPNSLLDQGIKEWIKEKYYKDIEVVDWSKLKAVLYFWQVKKEKFEYELSWKGSMFVDDTWVAVQYIPARISN